MGAKVAVAVAAAESVRWQGILVPLTTPFDESGALDHAGLERNLEAFAAAPLAGYVLAGSNGEFPQLGLEERILLVRGAARAAGDRPVLVQVGGGSRQESLALAARAAEFGARAVLLVTPHYYRRQMTDEALLEYYQDFAADCPLPLLLYNIPQNTGVNLSPAVVGQLASVPNIIGIKDSAGNLGQLAEYLERTPPGWSVLNGSSSLVVPAWAVGCSGAVLGAANMLPFELCDLWSLCREGRWAEAQTLESRLRPVLRVVSRLGVAGTKLGMDLMGYRGGAVRAPLLPVGRAQRDELVDALRGAQLIRF